MERQVHGVQFDPETMKIKICKKCKGVGFGQDLTGNRFKCSECGGTGRIIVKTLKNELGLDELGPNLSFDDETMKVRICRSCGGLGMLRWGSDERSCEDCGGSGRVIEQKIVTEYQLNEVEGLENPDGPREV